MKRCICAVLCALFFTMVLPASIAETADPAMIVIVVTDQYGVPVEGVMLSVCAGMMCVPGYTDENGCLTIAKDSDETEISIVSVPQGYSYTEEATYTLEGIANGIIIIKE